MKTLIVWSGIDEDKNDLLSFALLPDSMIEQWALRNVAKGNIVMIHDEPIQFWKMIKNPEKGSGKSRYPK